MLRAVGAVLWHHLVNDDIQCHDDEHEQKTEEEKTLRFRTPHSNLVHLHSHNKTNNLYAKRIYEIN